MKHVYLIAYDISDDLGDYSGLKDTIRTISDDYQHPLESIWFIKTEEPIDVKEICGKLKDYFQSTADKLYMAELSPEMNHSGWMPKPKLMWKWLKKL